MTQVLVADDDAPIRETLRLILEEEGYTVLEAANGTQALAQLRNVAERLVVLLDLVMPEPDGVAVLRDVAADMRIARRHEYIVVTAVNDAFVASVEPFLAAVSAQVVRKPFDIDEVLGVVAIAARRLAPLVS
jgi:two-component system, NtrC family, response regulator HydG